MPDLLHWEIVRAEHIADELLVIGNEHLWGIESRTANSVLVDDSLGKFNRIGLCP
jgi:hypothetical protein